MAQTSEIICPVCDKLCLKSMTGSLGDYFCHEENHHTYKAFFGRHEIQSASIKFNDYLVVFTNMLAHNVKELGIYCKETGSTIFYLTNLNQIPVFKSQQDVENYLLLS